jgi:hypothetical protein
MEMLSARREAIAHSRELVRDIDKRNGK